MVSAMVIGDGCLSTRSHIKTAFFECHHCDAQADYAAWKANLLRESLGGARVLLKSYTHMKLGVPRKYWVIRSKCLPELADLRSEMYPKSETFKRGVLQKRIGPRELAIIFMDDGCKNITRRVGWNNKSGRQRADCIPYISKFNIYLDGYGLDQVKIFCSWLLESYGIFSYPAKHREDGYFVAISRVVAKERFRNLVLPHMHPSMMYKLEGGFHVKVIHPERLSEKAPIMGGATV